MGSNLVSNTLSILAGASLGAIATYLLDPDQGDRRRQRIGKSAEHAVAATTDAVSSHLHRAVDAARDAAEKVTQYAEDAVDQIADRIQPTVNEANRQARIASGRAQAITDDWTGRANSIYANAKKTAMRRAGVQESHPVESFLGHTVGTVGVAAIGAGVMYFLDPAKGRARRDWAADKAFSWTRRAGKSARGYGRHLGNQLQGAAHDLKQSVPSQWSNVAGQAADVVEQAKEKVQPVVDRVTEAAK